MLRYLIHKLFFVCPRATYYKEDKKQKLWLNEKGEVIAVYREPGAVPTHNKHQQKPQPK